MIYVSSPESLSFQSAQLSGIYRNGNRFQDKTGRYPLGQGSIYSKDKIILISTALLKCSALSISPDKGREVGKIIKVNFYLT